MGLGAVTGVIPCTALLAPGWAATLGFACAQSALHYKLYLSADLNARTAAAWFKPAAQTEAHKVSATITDSMVA